MASFRKPGWPMSSPAPPPTRPLIEGLIELTDFCRENLGQLRRYPATYERLCSDVSIAPGREPEAAHWDRLDESSLSLLGSLPASDAGRWSATNTVLIPQPR